MTFKQAYAIAMKKSEEFRRHDARVKEAKAAGGDEIRTSCMIFAIGDETFYYGYDCGMMRGKHNPNRAAVLINRGEALIIE
jgi:hypothetical protein